MPSRHAIGAHRFAADERQPDRWRNSVGASRQLMPVGRGQIQHRDARAGEPLHERPGRRQHRIVPKDEGGAGGESRKDLFDRSVECQRRELERAVGGRQLERVDGVRDVVRERAAWNFDAFRRARRARGVDDVREIVTCSRHDRVDGRRTQEIVDADARLPRPRANDRPRSRGARPHWRGTRPSARAAQRHRAAGTPRPRP